jgi:ABC-2 type transport system permease protein
VLVNEEDPLKARLVNDTVEGLLAAVNRRLSRALNRENLGYLKLLINGGNVGFVGLNFNILGLRKTEQIMEGVRRKLPRGSPERRQLNRVIRFARLGQQSSDFTNRALTSASEPIGLQKKVLNGARVPLTTFAAAISVAISLMFVTVLLAAAALALEREENTFGRLVRGPVTRMGLLAEKIALAGACAVVVTLVMLVALGQFITLEWDRFPLWLLALVAGALAFAALGTAVGGVAREVSAASLLSFALLLPVAFLALVPSGVVSAAMYDFTRIVSALFPFKASLDAMNAALYGSGDLWLPLLHLAALSVAFAFAARLALRRFT